MGLLSYCIYKRCFFSGITEGVYCKIKEFEVPLPSHKNEEPGWWNGRHEGLKLLWPAMAVRVQVPLRVLTDTHDG